jgi:dynactin complex subunit
MQDINLIKNVIETPFVTNGMVIAFSVVVVAMLLAAFWFFYSRYHKKKAAAYKDVKPVEIILEKDYFAEAMERLKVVEVLLEKGLYKEFYLEITSLVKDFLSGVQKMNVVDMTSKETIMKIGLDDDKKGRLMDFLRKVDEAKFSGRDSSGFARETLVLASDFVKLVVNKL